MLVIRFLFCFFDVELQLKDRLRAITICVLYVHGSAKHKHTHAHAWLAAIHTLHALNWILNEHSSDEMYIASDTCLFCFFNIELGLKDLLVTITIHVYVHVGANNACTCSHSTLSCTYMYVHESVVCEHVQALLAVCHTLHVLNRILHARASIEI